MPGRIDFKHDAFHDIVIATPHWNVETEQDLFEWYQTYVNYMKRFSRKMDSVIVVDDFKVAPNLGSKWGEYRAKIHHQYLRYNFRVHCNPRVKLFTNTSGVRYNISREEAASVEDAIEGILEARRRENIKAG